ncbi:MAG TPA: heavy metal-associated domain-containing protein [Candidatus Limnocylindrales bacterium]|nr:heavy metal-associated domain-containing protein [Candidatus Limnocylindrales bacterium]
MAAETLYLALRGMTCANCTRTVERTLASTPGVTKATVDLASSSATIEYDSSLVKPEVLVDAVCDLGYEAKPTR